MFTFVATDVLYLSERIAQAIGSARAIMSFGLWPIYMRQCGTPWLLPLMVSPDHDRCARQHQAPGAAGGWRLATAKGDLSMRDYVIETLGGRLREDLDDEQLDVEEALTEPRIRWTVGAGTTRPTRSYDDL